MKPGKNVAVWQDYTHTQIFMGVFVSEGRHDRGVLRWRQNHDDTEAYRVMRCAFYAQCKSTLYSPLLTEVNIPELLGMEVHKVLNETRL